MKYSVTDILFSEFEDLEKEEEPVGSEEPETQETPEPEPEPEQPTQNPDQPVITSTWGIKTEPQEEEPKKKTNIKKIVKRMTDQLKAEYEEKSRVQKEEILDQVKEQIRVAVPSITSGVSGVVVGGAASITKSDALDIYEIGAKNYGSLTIQPFSTKGMDAIHNLGTPPLSFAWSVAIKTFGNSHMTFEIQTYFNGSGIEYNISNMVGDFLEFNVLPSINNNALLIAIQNESNRLLEIKFKRKY